jgi:hypothetical protein
MDIKAILATFTAEKEFTVEGQIRWLQKQGFAQDQIDHAILKVYFDLERGVIPVKWDTGSETVYLPGDTPKSGEHWVGAPIATGNELDQYLLQVAKDIRTKELSDKAAALGELVSKMKTQWEADAARASKKPGFFKRMFGNLNHEL